MCVLRLAQALARLRLNNMVAKDDVDEALRLLRTARSSLEPDMAARRPAADATTAIYHIIRDAADELQTGSVRLPEVLDTIRLRGFSDAQLQQCLDEYQRINVWQVAPGRDAVTFV
jgi:DNA replication licensing factor MCM7